MTSQPNGERAHQDAEAGAAERAVRRQQRLEEGLVGAVEAFVSLMARRL